MRRILGQGMKGNQNMMLRMLSCVGMVALFCLTGKAAAPSGDGPKAAASKRFVPTDPEPMGAESRVFRPGAIWKDNNGVHINAHSAGLLYRDGVYWWYGEHKIAGGAGNFAQVGVHVYSSRDLYNWKDEGIALSVSEQTDQPLRKGCIIERPKVVFNQKTGKFVMWFHYEKDASYSSASAGIAISDKPEGPFAFLGLVRPNAGVRPRNGTDLLMSPLSGDERKRGNPPAGSTREQEADYFFRLDMARGHDVRDQTLFIDEDGVAYHIHSAERNRTLHVSRLTDDYLKPAGDFTRVLVGKLYEAPAMLKKDGKYWLFGSHCTGWAPNSGRLAVADSIFGPYTETGNPWKGPANALAVSYDSQSTFVLPVEGKHGEFIYLADRWRPNNAIDGRYIWLPVMWENGKPVLEWKDSWGLGVFEKWLPILNANPARQPRALPDPLPPVQLVPGPFSPDRKAPAWKEIKGPQWLYDGKIGIGLHWGPSSLEGRFAWPGRYRYGENRKEFDAKYGHPSNMGWKDICNLWRAEKFDADKLGALFKASGFCFVAAQAAHHDRFDMFDSTFRPWNSVNAGPHRDILKEWREACRKHGLRFGITDHSDWSWYMASAFGSDKEGPWAGIPFDGLQTKADGAGKWWNGLDPVDFYGPQKGNKEFLDRQWYLRSIELVRNYQPDIWWQDGNFHNLSLEMGRNFISSYYNLNAQQHGGKPEGIIILKQHPSSPVLMTNYEIHKSIQTTPYPWMTDTTCYGPWFYDEPAERGCMYTSESLVQFVADIVSRNGTLLLNVTLRPDGTLPQPQADMLAGFGRWMAVNGEAIYGTRPWYVFCDHGYSTTKPLEPSAWQKFKPGEIRYTCKDKDTVYAIVFGVPKKRVILTQFNETYGGEMNRDVTGVKLLGWQGDIQWKMECPYNLEGSGLAIQIPEEFKGEYAAVFKITLAKADPR